MTSSKSQPKNAASSSKVSPPESPTASSPPASPPSQSSPDPSILFSPSDPPEAPEMAWVSDVDDDFGSAPPAPERAPESVQEELQDIARTTVTVVTGLAHDLLTAEGSPEREAGLYLADEDDLEGIADPLASLASRRMPAGAGNPDVGDLMRLGFDLVGYWIKNRVQRMQLRTATPEPPSATEPPPAS